jgi:hypothetical protein
MQLNLYISLFNVNIKQKLLTYDLIDRKISWWVEVRWARGREEKENFYKHGWSRCLKKRFPQKVAADGGRDFSLLNKLVRVTTKKSLSNAGNATFYLLVLKFSAWLQTFHADWSEMTTGRHFYRPIGSNKFRLNPKLLAKLAKLGTLSIKLLKMVWFLPLS